MYFCGLFSLSDWDECVLYIVLDDVAIRFFPQWKFFLGAQKEGILTDKYMKKKRVRNGLPCIWVTNNHIYNDLDNETDKDWLEKNTVTVFISNKLY